MFIAPAEETSEPIYAWQQAVNRSRRSALTAIDKFRSLPLPVLYVNPSVFLARLLTLVAETHNPRHSVSSESHVGSPAASRRPFHRTPAALQTPAWPALSDERAPGRESWG